MSKTKTIDKSPIIQAHQAHKSDTGSPEIQVALLSARIAHLTDHLKQHSKDAHTRRGLIQMTNRRRKLLRYLKSRNLQHYQELVKALGLRG